MDRPARTLTDIADLRPQERNANKGTARGVGMLEESLRRYGAGRSIVVDRNGQTIAGSKTLETAADIGLPVRIVPTDGRELVVVQRTDLDLDTDRAAHELAVADNRVGQVDLEWDTEALAALAAEGMDLGAWWTGEEMAALLGEEDRKEGAGGDDFDTTPDESGPTRCQPGDLWQLGEHRLLCGDSTKAEDVARVMGGEKAEMVWTDPPYGVAIGDKNRFLNSIAPSNRVEENLTNDTLDEPALTEMLRAAFHNAAAHCLAGAAWYVAAPARPLHVLFGQVLKDMGIWRQTIQWVKNNATLAPMGVDYHWRAEPIFYGWVPGAGHRWHGGRKQDTVWEVDRPAKSPDHPTMKPIELVQRAVENSSAAREVVLDVFLGSGTTLIAAERTGRRCRGIEIEPRYADVILRRWEAETGREAVLLERPTAGSPA